MPVAPGGEEGRGKLRKTGDRCKQPLDPRVSEWDNPPCMQGITKSEANPVN